MRSMFVFLCDGVIREDTTGKNGTIRENFSNC